MLDLITLIIGFILVALVSGNNLSVCFGGAISSRILSRRTGTILAILGYIAGLLLQGSVLGAAAHTLFPQGSVAEIDAVLLVVTVMFILSQAKRIPQSLSITLTMALWGWGMAAGTINWLFMGYTVAFWIVAPVLSLLFAVFLMKLFGRVKLRRVWSYTRKMRIALVVASFFVAFTLGANTLGLFMNLLPNSQYLLVVIIAAIVAGCVFLSSGPLKLLGNEILPMRYTNAAIPQFVSAIFVEIATLLHIPVSNTQAFVSSIYGAGLSYKVRILLRKPLMKMIYMWVLTGLVSMGAGFIIALVLH